MSNELRVGAGSASISPDNAELLTLSDMGRAAIPAGVVQGNGLSIDAIALEAGGELLIIATYDAGVWSARGEQPVGEVIAERTGVKASHLRILSRHNHSGWASPLDRDDPKAVEAAEAFRRKKYLGTIDACCRAVESLRPAEIASATAMLTETVGTNRRMRYSTGGVCPSWAAGPISIPGEKFAGPADPDPKRITFLCAREIGAAEPFVVLTSYGSHIHLTGLHYLSGEVAGGVKNAFAKRLPAATIVYGNGFNGDVDMHSTYPIGTEDLDGRIAWFRKSTEILGKRFVKAVMAAMPTEGYTRPAEMKFLEYSTTGRQSDRRTRSYILRAFRLGEIAIATTPAEMFSAFAEQVHKASPFDNLILLSFDRGARLGYIGTPISYEQGGYEVGKPRYSADTEAAMIAAGVSARGRRRRMGGARPHTGVEITADTIALLEELAKP